METIYEKIEGYLRAQKKRNPRDFRGDDKEVAQLSAALQMIYFTYPFESAAYMELMGNYFISYRNEQTIAALIKAYTLLNHSRMLQLISKAEKLSTQEEMLTLNKEYLRFEEELKLCKITYIRSQTKAFLIHQ